MSSVAHMIMHVLNGERVGVGSYQVNARLSIAEHSP